MGPLKHLRIVEFAGVGPGPFAAMLLADLGAKVIRIERRVPSGLGVSRPRELDYTLRGRDAIALDLKTSGGQAVARELVKSSDVLIESYRPGVMERLGLGPEQCLKDNSSLIYGRMTGWGQTGPLADTVGHDLNYLSITGVLHAIGREGHPPSVPLNLLGDNAGGAMYLVLGVLSALLEREHSGEGQVIDAAIVDGVASLAVPLYGFLKAGLLSHQRGSNVIDSGAHFYDVYECSDGKWLSIAPLEVKFYNKFLELIGLEINTDQMDKRGWKNAKKRIAEKIKTRTQSQWVEFFGKDEVCCSPVLNFEEAMHHPHLVARGTFVKVGTEVQPKPAPQFGRSKLETPSPGKVLTSKEDVASMLSDWMQSEQVEWALKEGQF